MLEKMKSRKFVFALLGAVLPLVAQYFSGDITLTESLQLSAAVVVSYIFGQGYVDAAAAKQVKG
tara:strand:+ start:405 stop:596 length:192 start_codon:yes stop_codon:yes gene_type:complete